MSQATWIILGGSSAIARAFAHEVAMRGFDTVLAGRDAEDLARIAGDIEIRTGTSSVAVPFDALDLASHTGFASTWAARIPGRINLFLAFGIMPSQAACEADLSLMRAMVETNFLGAASILIAFAPVLETQRGGTVMVLGSVAGDRGRGTNYLYGATKSALHTFLQGYRACLSRSGVRVVTLKAGVVDTGMTWPSPKLPFAVSPAAFAHAAYRLADKGATSAYVPGIWWWVMTIIRLIPTPIFNRLEI